MSAQRIRKDDVVVAISGNDAGKTGKVLKVFPKDGKAIVEGLNIVKKTIKKSQSNPQGGIIEREAPMLLTKLMLYCPNDKKGVRINRVKDGNVSVRKCRSCGHAFGG